jgi:hypothetical protein
MNDREGSAALTTRHPSIHKSWQYISSTNGSRSVGIVPLRTKGHGVFLFIAAKMLLPNNCHRCISTIPSFDVHVTIFWNIGLNLRSVVLCLVLCRMCSEHSDYKEGQSCHNDLHYEQPIWTESTGQSAENIELFFWFLVRKTYRPKYYCNLYSMFYHGNTGQARPGQARQGKARPGQARPGVLYI